MEIYNRYYKAMYNTAFRIVKNSFEAEDIMQEAFLSAFTMLDTLLESTTFGAWLKRIVVNKSIYNYTKNGKYQHVPVDAVLYKLEDESTSLSSDETANSPKVKVILNAINGLKDTYRIALTLHLIEGFDYEEIGQITNVSYANCRTTVSRAKEKLRQALQPVMNY
ncbi:RNA polymerase sigma factor [Bizionia myxarmorum]|uniref:RNA polymerase sigma factor n=1 Tax=Bizionia myxarmorum TaxID=291186 RepID=A0A5D0RFX1_9FLAO|nr:RNA polymerase sigma factor [Bizionia myxarmorum]